jgi:hypothetical protein
VISDWLILFKKGNMTHCDSSMKIGSEPENCKINYSAHSTESIPTKTTNRKKRAQERKQATSYDLSSENEINQKDSIKSKSQIINSDPLNQMGIMSHKRKKKKKKVVNDQNKKEKITEIENESDESSKPIKSNQGQSTIGVNQVQSENNQIKGYKDFNQLQAEQAALKKAKRKKQNKTNKNKTSNSASSNPSNNNSNGNSRNNSNNNSIIIKEGNPSSESENNQTETKQTNNEINKTLKQTTEEIDPVPELPVSRSTSGGDEELPETYIEEIVTERQFIGEDGKVKTEVTTIEQLKTKKKKKSKNEKSKVKPSSTTTRTEHIDVATGLKDSVIKDRNKHVIKSRVSSIFKCVTIKNESSPTMSHPSSRPRSRILFQPIHGSGSLSRRIKHRSSLYININNTNYYSTL